jgi:hypothetical protein
VQAQARVHRIGQQRSVSVYRLVTRNTYEAEMFERASKKLGLDQAVLSSMQVETSTSGMNVLALLERVATMEKFFSKKQRETPSSGSRSSSGAAGVAPAASNRCVMTILRLRTTSP